MEECQTPNVEQAVKFTFGNTPQTITSSTTMQDIKNLMVSKSNSRCFTPRVEEFQSPGLSPIYGITFKVSPGTPSIHYNGNLKKPTDFINQKVLHASPNKKKSKELQELLQKQKQLQQRQIVSGAKETSFTSSKDKDECENGSDTMGKPLETSKSSIGSGILNQSLNVTLILKSVGLAEYAASFEKAGCFNVDKFLNMDFKDLEQMGLKSKEHCKIIMDLLKELNN